MGRSNTLVINQHVTKDCNYRCKFCFPDREKNVNLPNVFKNPQLRDKLLSEYSKLDVISSAIGENISDIRINLIGGEPLLLGKKCTAIAKQIKEMGFTVSLTTNGLLLQEQSEILKYLDIIHISIDSLEETVCKAMGRCAGNQFVSKERLYSLVKKIREINPKVLLRFNVVVSRFNCDDSTIISQLQKFKPNKIKIVQQLSDTKDEGISEHKFKRFIKINDDACKQTNVAVMNNSDLVQSCLMVGEDGRIFQNGSTNSNDGYHYSEPIVEAGFKKAFSQVPFSIKKWKQRYQIE